MNKLSYTTEGIKASDVEGQDETAKGSPVNLDLFNNLLDENELKTQEEEDEDDTPNKVIFTLFCAADKMTAYIRAQDYKKGKNADNRVDPDIIYALLKEEKITYGINEDGIDEYCLGKTFYKDFEVAKGVRPEKGKDGSVEYFFAIEKRYAPKMNENGTVNYKEMENVHNVDKGDILCRVNPPTEGIPGINVFGEAVPPKPGKPATIGYGNGVELSEDGNDYLAAQNGMVEINNGTVEVKDVYTVSGDVGPATGNIRFNGAVVVKGNVLSDYSVFANGDIIVNGYVESSLLNASGNIMINNGVNGMKKGLIKANGNITTKFAEMARIVAGGDFFCDYCINCDVRAMGNIICKGRRGSLLGGSYIAGSSVEVSTVGSDLNLSMDIQIIPNWQSIRNLKLKPEERIREFQEAMAQCEAAYATQKKSFDKLETEIMRLSKKTSMESREETEFKKKRIIEVVQQRSELKAELDEIDKKRQSLEMIMDGEGCRVIVKNIIHTGVRVVIGTAMLRVNGHKQVVTFAEEDGEIATYNIVAGDS